MNIFVDSVSVGAFDLKYIMGVRRLYEKKIKLIINIVVQFR